MKICKNITTVLCCLFYVRCFSQSLFNQSTLYRFSWVPFPMFIVWKQNTHKLPFSPYLARSFSKPPNSTLLIWIFCIKSIPSGLAAKCFFRVNNLRFRLHLPVNHHPRFKHCLRLFACLLPFSFLYRVDPGWSRRFTGFARDPRGIEPASRGARVIHQNKARRRCIAEREAEEQTKPSQTDGCAGQGRIQ